MDDDGEIDDGEPLFGDRFRATHVITHNGAETRVRVEWVAIYTREEWAVGAFRTRWTTGPRGTLSRNGRIPRGSWSIRPL